MEDHIFGTFATDQLKHLHNRISALGLQHGARVRPRDPSPGEEITLTVTSGPDFPAREVVVCFTSEPREPTLDDKLLSMTAVRHIWSTAAWGYVTEWQAILPPQAEGVLLRYRIAGRVPGGGWRWADWPQPKLAVEHALTKQAPAPGETEGGSDFALSIDRFAPPSWVESAVIYQIFLDRFSPDEDAAWKQPVSLADIYGGTLRGACARLKHIRRLGANCIWLSPLFPSPSHHGYDATDYYSVEPRLGTADDLRALIQEAHRLGLRVLLDFVCNHVSHEHPVFRRASADPESEEQLWFWFDSAFQPHGYRTFFNVAAMPELNTDHPTVRRHLIDAAKMWLREFDVDGFRLDYANGPSYAFWAEFWRAVKQTKPEAWCFGEVVDLPSYQRRYQGYLDGVLDFHLSEGLRKVFAHGSKDMLWLDDFLHRHESYFPSHDRLSRPAFLDNHDMDRFLFAAQGDERRLRLAAIFLYSLPNPPLIYYGTEIGLTQRLGKGQGHGLEVSREPMDWNRAASRPGLLEFFERLGALRQREEALRPYSRTALFVASDQYVVWHVRNDVRLLVALNRADASVSLDHGELQGTFVDLLTDETLVLCGVLTLAAWSGRLLKQI